MSYAGSPQPTGAEALIKVFTEWFNATADTNSDPMDVVPASIIDALYGLDPKQVERLRSMIAQDCALVLARNAAVAPE